MSLLETRIDPDALAGLSAAIRLRRALLGALFWTAVGVVFALPSLATWWSWAC